MDGKIGILYDSFPAPTSVLLQLFLSIPDPMHRTINVASNKLCTIPRASLFFVLKLLNLDFHSIYLFLLFPNDTDKSMNTGSL